MRARTARIPHLCESCSWTPSLRGVPTIMPGHRYLLHTAFPDGEINTSERPYALKECVSCAEGRTGDGVLLAGSCSRFCCGVVLCARPYRHDGDHSCRRCVAARAGERGSGTPFDQPK